MAVSKLSSAYAKLKNTKWSFNNTFRCTFEFEDPTKTNALNGGPYDEVYLVKANIPALSATPDVQWINHSNFQTMSTVEIMTVTIDFLDHDQLELYRFWSKHFMDQLNSYLDDYKFSVTFTKLPDNPDEEEFQIAKIEDCVVNSVSQLDLNTGAEGSGTILTFSITLQTPKIVVNNQNKEGHIDNSKTSCNVE